MKATKDEAHYRSGRPEKHCSICTMFRSPDKCAAVSGKINPHGLCDYFKRKA